MTQTSTRNSGLPFALHCSGRDRPAPSSTASPCCLYLNQYAEPEIPSISLPDKNRIIIFRYGPSGSHLELHLIVCLIGGAADPLKPHPRMTSMAQKHPHLPKLFHMLSTWGHHLIAGIPLILML